MLQKHILFNSQVSETQAYQMYVIFMDKDPKS